MDDIDKRPRYFNGQFLDQDDFNLALDYVRERAQRHQRLLHSPGVADGLTVTAGVGASTVAVAPGSAVDALGRQIVLLESRSLALTNLPDQTALVVISYHEESADPAAAGAREDTRWLERPEVTLVLETGAPPEDTHQRLARLQLEGGKVKVHDPGVRRSSGARLGASLETQKLSLSRDGVAPASWPSLTCGAADRADIATDLRVARDLTVRGALNLVVSGKPLSLSGVDGKLGIGTTDPKALVEVNSGNADVSPIFAVTTPSGGDFFSIYGARQSVQSTDLLWRRGPLRFGTATSFGGQAFSEKLRITETGEVGLGASDPGTYRLAIRQAASATGRGLRVLSADSTTTVQLWAGGGGGVLDAEGTANLQLRTGGQDRLFLDKAGNVGIGTTSPQGGLHVVSSSAPQGALVIQNSHAKGYTHFDYPDGKNYIRGTTIMADSDGNVGIGLQAPAEKLHVAGNARIDGVLYVLRASDGTNAGFLNLGREPAADNFWHMTQRAGDQDKLMIFRHDPGQYKGPYLTIATDGKVGIGTSAPAATLHVAGTSILGQEDWKTPTFQNNWKNYGSSFNTAGFMIDSLGFVHLRGLVKDGMVADTIPIFTLPAGYAPPLRQLHAVQTNPNTVGRVDILSDGRICVIAGNNAWVSLDGITFRAGTTFVGPIGPIGPAPIGPIGPILPPLP